MCSKEFGLTYREVWALPGLLFKLLKFLSDKSVSVPMVSLPSYLIIFPNRVTHGGPHGTHLIVYANKVI